MSTKVLLKRVRLAFPVLGKPEQFQGEGKAQFSATLLFDKTGANYDACQAAMRAAAVKEWGEAKADAAVKGLVQNLKTALRDGDLKKDYQGFEGNWSLSCRSKATAPPKLLAGNKTELPRDTGAFYPGCYVNVSVDFWAQDNQYGKRINATILVVQFAGDGDNFSGGAEATTDEFEVVEGADGIVDIDPDFA